MGLAELVSVLREDRRAIERAKEQLMATQEALQAIPEYQAYGRALEALQQARFAAERDEQAVRDEAEALYRQNGEKHPHPSIGIRVSRIPRYDPQAVYTWLLSNAPTYLTVDTKRFEKAADGLPGAPVTWAEKVTATIATDLNKGA